MDSTRTCTAIVALVVHLAAATAHGQSFDDEALRRDAGRLLTMDAARRLFNTEEVVTLRTLLQSASLETVERLMASKASIQVTINPEARVSVSRTPAALPLFTCGTAEPLLVRIVNQGRVSSVLSIRLVGEVAAGIVSLAPTAPRLAGASVEYRVLMITLNTVSLIEFTLVVDAGPGTEDLGLRSQLPVLAQCSAPPTGSDSVRLFMAPGMTQYASRRLYCLSAVASGVESLAYYVRHGVEAFASQTPKLVSCVALVAVRDAFLPVGPAEETDVPARRVAPGPPRMSPWRRAGPRTRQSVDLDAALMFPQETLGPSPGWHNARSQPLGSLPPHDSRLPCDSPKPTTQWV
jgi:hypothetical protein